MSNITDTIKLLNPWWEDKRVSEELAKEYKRGFFDKIQEFKKYRQIIILTGLRRVGKTTLIYQTVKERLKEINAKNIFILVLIKRLMI